MEVIAAESAPSHVCMASSSVDEGVGEIMQERSLRTSFVSTGSTIPRSEKRGVTWARGEGKRGRGWAGAENATRRDKKFARVYLAKMIEDLERERIGEGAERDRAEPLARLPRDRVVVVACLTLARARRDVD
jgi:hypothetical protein